MEEETLKDILKRDLKTPPSSNFNNRVISEIKSQKQKKAALYDEKSIIIPFILIGLCVFAQGYLAKEESGFTEIMVVSIISLLPVFLIIYNKIYLLHNKKQGIS